MFSQAGLCAIGSLVRLVKSGRFKLAMNGRLGERLVPAIVDGWLPEVLVLEDDGLKGGELAADEDELDGLGDTGTRRAGESIGAGVPPNNGGRSLNL